MNSLPMQSHTVHQHSANLSCRPCTVSMYAIWRIWTSQAATLCCNRLDTRHGISRGCWTLALLSSAVQVSMLCWLGYVIYVHFHKAFVPCDRVDNVLHLAYYLEQRKQLSETHCARNALNLAAVPVCRSYSTRPAPSRSNTSKCRP